MCLIVESAGARAKSRVSGPRPDADPAVVEGLMETYLVKREGLLSQQNNSPEDLGAMLQALDAIGKESQVLGSQLELQSVLFRHKGYALLGTLAWPGTALARQRAQETLVQIRPPLRNVTYLDWGDVKVIYRGDSRVQEIALTYDDGPIAGTSGTRAILDVLDEFGAKASFFVVGQQVKAAPGILREILARGHTLGNHTQTHARGKGLPLLSASVIRKEIGDGLQAILDSTGLERIPIFRLPYGAGVNSRKVNEILAEYHPYSVFWTIDTRDWKKRGADKSYESVVNSKELNGSIVLMHDHAPGVVNATRRILETLIPQGFKFVTVEQLLGVDPGTSYYGRFATASRNHGEGHHAQAYEALVTIARTAPSLSLAREALDYAYQIARRHLEPNQSDEARRQLAATLHQAASAH